MNELNLENYWMPFTGNKAFKANPRLIVEAKGGNKEEDSITSESKADNDKESNS